MVYLVLLPAILFGVIVSLPVLPDTRHHSSDLSSDTGLTETREKPRYLNDRGEEEWPDEILLPGFLALQASDLAGYMVSNMAFKLTKALLYMLWL